MRRRAGAGLGLVVVVTALLAGTGSAGAVPGRAEPRPQRVLVFSLPHVSWGDVESHELPNLRRLLGRSGVAGLTVGSDDDGSARLADGYLTLGAGTRAEGDPRTDGDAVGVAELFGRDTGGEVYEQRTGHVVRRGIVSLAEPRIREINDELLYDAELGALADALATAGVQRAVIANGDGQQPDTPPNLAGSGLRRQAALAVMSSLGVVPRGRVDDGLLEAAPAAPYGFRLDQDAVLDSFDAAWKGRSVVLVEASDLVREDAFRAVTDELQRDRLLGQALRASDRLLGRLLEHVDLRRDAVIVVGPAHMADEDTLTVLGVHAPGVEPGLLRSGTTGRSGFVQLVDVAPTILELLDVDRPASMEGRPVEVASTGGDAQERADFLVREDEAAQFRDDQVGATQATLVVAVGVLVAWVIAATSRPGRARALAVLGWAALCVLALLPAVFLTRLVPLHEAGVLPYWASVVLLAILLGTVFHRVGRSNPLDALLVAFLTIVALLSLDVLAGSHLQFNSALGYSPTVAGRFVGFSDPASAALGASAVLAAPLLAHRIGGRRGAWAGIALMTVVVVVDGAPFWGADAGGTLSLVPAFLITGVLLLGRRVRWRTLAWSLTALVVAVTVFTLIDLSRSPDRRTHLGRLAERIDERGFGDVVVVLQRKLADNLGSIRSSVLALAVVILVVLAIWLVWRKPDRLGAITTAVPETRVAALGFAILAVLGYAFNDSGIAVPGTMAVILVTATIWLVVRIPPGPDPGVDGGSAQPERTLAATAPTRSTG